MAYELSLKRDVHGELIEDGRIDDVEVEIRVVTAGQLSL